MFVKIWYFVCFWNLSALKQKFKCLWLLLSNINNQKFLVMKRVDVPLHKIHFFINSTSINQRHKRTMKQKHKYFVHNSHSASLQYNNPIVLHSNSCYQCIHHYTLTTDRKQKCRRNTTQDRCIKWQWVNKTRIRTYLFTN